MSYICMLANESGIAAAGDSRLTLFPIPLHLDRSRKVFVAPERGLIWGCCGLTVWGGINCVHLTGHILRRPWPLERKLEAIRRRVEPVLRMCHRIHRKDVRFTLLLGVAEPGQVRLYTLDLVNGNRHRLRQWNAPSITEGGWQSALRPPFPKPELFRYDTPEELVARARQRVQWAVERDHTLSETKPAHRPTVGGTVRSVLLRVPDR